METEAAFIEISTMNIKSHFNLAEVFYNLDNSCQRFKSAVILFRTDKTIYNCGN